jgi:hypothetical protein
MCVILQKTIGQDIPFEALQRAALRNPHGFGVMVADRGELVATRGVCEKAEKGAEEVAKALEELKDMPTLIHFRYATAGSKTLGNTHPFELLKLDADGIDLQLMHNGTMSYFKDPSRQESDTALFCESVASPLLQRWWAYVENEDELINDPALKKTLEAIVGAGVLTLMTGSGKVMKINEDYGEVYPWGWASNKNPLVEDKTKRKDTKSHYGPSTLETAATSYNNASAWSPPEHWKPANQNKSTRSLDDQGAALRDMIRLSPNSKVTLPVPRTRLDAKDFLGTFELEDLVWLDLDDVRDLIKKCPEATAIILMDLLFKLYLDAKGKPLVSYGKGDVGVETN